MNHSSCGHGGCGQAPAQAQPSRYVAIKAGRLLDVRSGNVTMDVHVLVENDRIASVGGAVPAGVPIIDLSNATVLPGLIDCHAHLLGDWRDPSATEALRRTSAMATLWGARNLRAYLHHGFTTLRGAGEDDPAYGQLALRDGVELGLIRGPRIVSAGQFISVTGGHGDSDVLAADQALPRRPNIADTVDEVSVAVRRDLKYGADWIKLMATGGVSDPLSDFTVQELSEEQMARAVELAHRAHKRVMAHAEGAEGIKAAVRAGVDSIEHGTLLDDEGAALMAEKGTWLVPTLFTFQDIDPASADPAALAKEQAILPYQQRAFERALKYELKLAFGSDDNPDYALAKEFDALVRAGLPPLEAIRTATLNASELLGLSSDIGTVEAGKLADIIAVCGDPLQDIAAMSQVVFVMKSGEVVSRYASSYCTTSPTSSRI